MAGLTIKEIEEHLLVMDAVINDEHYGIISASVNFLETTRDALRQLLKATLAEREACAKIADRFGMPEGYNFPEESEATAMTIAAAIRSRSETDE